VALPSPLLAVPNVTSHPSTASVPITALLYDCPLLCGFNVAIKGLKSVLLRCCLGDRQGIWTTQNPDPAITKCFLLQEPSAPSLISSSPVQSIAWKNLSL